MKAANILAHASALFLREISEPSRHLARIADAMKSVKLWVVIVILAGSIGASAQTQPDLENGFKHWGSYDSSHLDTVNLENGNLMLHAPLLPGYPQRGKFGLQDVLAFNSKTWQVACQSDPTTPNTVICGWVSGGTGITLQRSVDLAILRTDEVFNSGTGNQGFTSKDYILISPDGAAHNLAVLAYGPKPQFETASPSEMETVDTTGYHVTMSGADSNGVPNIATVTDRHGNQYLAEFQPFPGDALCPAISTLPTNHLPSIKNPFTGEIYAPMIDDAPMGTLDCPQVQGAYKVTDSNGNFMNLFDPAGVGAGADTLGKALPLESGNPAPDNTGCPTPSPGYGPWLMNYSAPDGTTRQMKLCYTYLPIATAFNVALPGGSGGSIAVFEAPYLAQRPQAQAPNVLPPLSAVILADGTSWVFTYDNYGEINNVTLPGGGSISYTWTTVSQSTSTASCIGGYTHWSRAVATRKLNDGLGNSYTWTYTWGTPVNGVFTNKVTDPLGNATAHTFTALDGPGGCSFYETSTQFYQGAQSPANLVNQVDTTYYPVGSFTTPAGDNVATNVVPKDITTTLYPSLKVSKIHREYDAGLGAGLPIFGNVKKEFQYDWGQGAPGPLLRETDTTYQWEINSAYLTAHLLDLPAAVVVYDGNHTMMAETDYVYDETAYLTTPSPAITTQHNTTPPIGVRGNLTTVNRWVNITGTSIGVVATHTNWYDTGEPYQQFDPLGHITTHSYDPIYKGAYSTQTCLPATVTATGTVQHCTSGTYDLNTGVLTSLSNENAVSQAAGNTPGDQAHTSNFSYDYMFRVTSAQVPPDPDNGGLRAQTGFAFSGPNVLPLTVTRSKSITNALTDSATATFDGLARNYKTEHPTPDGDVIVDTTFDLAGRVASVSNPYLTKTDPTYGLTQTAYDTLDRAMQVTKQDGAISTVDYSAGNCTLSTDEAGKQRRGCSDALGRLVEVDEPGGPDPGLQATTALTISGTFNTTTVPPGTPRLAAAGSALASLTMSDGSTHTFYFDSNHHLCQLYWTSASGWVTQDLTAATSWTVAAGSSSIAGVVLSDGSVRIAYLSVNQHVNLMSWSGGSWSNEDVTAETGNAVVAGGSAVAITGSAYGSVMHMFYLGTNQHVYHMGWSASWVNEDLTAATGNTLAGASSAVAAMVMNDGSLHVNYLGTNNHVLHLSCCFPALSASGWVNQDLTTMAGSAVAAANTSLALHGVSYSSPFHIYYMAANQHVYHAWWNTSGWGSQDLTAATGNTLAATNTKLTVNLSDADGVIRLHYLGANLHVYELYFGGSSWGNADLMVLSGATVMAVSGSALSSHGGVVGSPVSVFYQGPDQHIYRMLWNSGAVAWQDTDPLPAASNVIVDAGTVSLTIPNTGANFTANACYGTSTNAFCAGKPVNSSPGAIASALATALNGIGSPVSAVAVGSSINLTWLAPAATTATIAFLVSVPDNPAKFPAGSFSSSAATFSGGLDPSTQSVRNPSVTLYHYDALGNLLCIHQKALDTTADKPCRDASVLASWRERWFSYNALGQLLTAYNPESGQINYQYDPDGNLWQKDSPAPNQLGSARQVISYCYDELNRVTGRAWSAQNCSNGQLPPGTAVVSYIYDTGANGIGHLSTMNDAAGQATYSYDILGRLSSETRKLPDVSGATSGISKTLSYDYNLDGSLMALHYPSGAKVTYTPDSAGRTVSAVDSVNAINYVTGATYGPDGAMTGFVSGNSTSFAGISNSFSYNKRLQPMNMSSIASATSSSPAHTVFSIGYDSHMGSTVAGNGNNGNVYGITNFKDTTRNQTFTYDALNRLISAQNAGTDCTQMLSPSNSKFWGNTYGYDAWGNLLSKVVTKCSSEPLSVSVGTNNRISSAGFVYDAAGNMISDGPSHNYTYDPENRLTGTGTYAYTYDGDGNRVEKANGTAASSGTLYWYMTPGVVAESDLAGTLKSEYAFFGGERVARRDLPAPASVSYYVSDHLKTASVITDSAGNIISESDYYPWGGELQFVNNDSNHYKFTGKERDTETQFDYFGARYYSNILGRFITPDFSAVPVPVPYADLIDPQSLNQYTYVRNIPTVKVDLDGHGCPPVCEPPTDAAVRQVIKEVGESIAKAEALASGARITVGAAFLMGLAMTFPQALPGGTVGQSDADEIAERDRLDAENAQKLGHAQGADENKSQSDIANERARTNGGFVDVHGNSHATEKPTQGYSLRDKDTGEVLKYGETTQGTARYSQKYLDDNNAVMKFEAKGTKAQMHKWQHNKILEYKKQNNGARPPLNENDY